MNHHVNQAERLHFQDYCSRDGYMGNYTFFWLLRQQHRNHDFTRCTNFFFIDLIKNVFSLWIRTPLINFLHAQFTREETTMKINEHKTLLFVAAYIAAQFICTWNINTKIKYLPPYQLYKVYLETTSMVNPRPGLQLIPVQHTFIIVHNTAKQPYH